MCRVGEISNSCSSSHRRGGWTGVQRTAYPQEVCVSPPRSIPGLHRVGPVILLDGPAVQAVLDALFIAENYRRYSGNSVGTFSAIAQVLAAALVSGSGQSDMGTDAEMEHVRLRQESVSIQAAAAMLELSPRQVRRLAPKLGGRIVGGRWLLDRIAITEHLHGKES